MEIASTIAAACPWSASMSASCWRRRWAQYALHAGACHSKSPAGSSRIAAGSNTARALRRPTCRCHAKDGNELRQRRRAANNRPSPSCVPQWARAADERRNAGGRHCERDVGRQAADRRHELTWRSAASPRPNGAPYCVSAAEALCRQARVPSGTIMDFTSAGECPVRTPARPNH